MSEIKLNLVDANQILHGTVHGSVTDAVVAALSAEPETLVELEAAIARFIKPVSTSSQFLSFQFSDQIDSTPWDAGIVIVDLAARIVASESTYSTLIPTGEIPFHDGLKSTDVMVRYRVPDDWTFVYSIAEYTSLREDRRNERAANPPLDAREILYGRPLLEWIVETTNSAEVAALWNVLKRSRAQQDKSETLIETPVQANEVDQEQDGETNLISVIHARWLMTPRDDLRGLSPREVLFAKRDFIDFDISSRELQWSFLDEGPPCLSVDSFAYRFAGFGIHEWVIYYDLVRHLLWSALLRQHLNPDDIQKIKYGVNAEGLESKYVNADSDSISCERTVRPYDPTDVEGTVKELEEFMTAWLERTQNDYDLRTPAILIDNERKRLPIAIHPREMIVDENCPTCMLLANDPSLGVGFWHLDGSNMDDDFVFSHHRTREEWEAERLEWQAFSEKFNREWEEKQQRIARGESLDAEHDLMLDVIDSDVQPSDHSEADDPRYERGWGPRGWGVS